MAAPNTGLITTSMKVGALTADQPQFGYAAQPFGGRGGYFHRDAAPPRAGRVLNVNFRLASANTEIIRERRTAVINAREVDRNNTMIRSGITKRAIDMVGMNLRLQAMPNYEALGLTEEWASQFAETWENQFSLWAEDPRKLNDATRHNTFGMQMFEGCRNTYGADGEVAMIVRLNEQRRKKYRGRFATFVETIDPDRISNPDNRVDDERLVQGRALDEWGAFEGLHIERRHPSEARGRRTWDYVPRETSWGRPVGIHWFPRFRAGAQRAMPAILSTLREVRMLDTFDNKTLEQAAKAAFMSIFIKTDKTTAEALAQLQGAPTGGEADAFANAMDTRFGLYEELNIDGQSIPMMAPGDEIEIKSASHASNNTDSFRFAWERKFASLLGLGYARFSNDYSKTSFASIRGEFIDAWRMTYADRYAYTVSVPALIAMAHLEECVIRGLVEIPAGAPDFYDNWDAYAQCDFRGPGMGWVDPVKDVTGAGLRVTSGLSNPVAEAAAQGSDFFDNINATARAMRYAEKKKVRITFGNNATSVDPEPEPDPNATAADGGDPAPAPASQDNAQ